MARTFTIVVERDPDSGWLVGEVVEPEEPLPDFVGTWRVDVTA